MTRSFGAFLTWDEITSVLSETLSGGPLTVLLNHHNILSEVNLSKPPDISLSWGEPNLRLIIAENLPSKNLPELIGTYPPPHMVLDVPVPKPVYLQPMWMSYKIDDEHLDHFPGRDIAKLFSALSAKFRRALIGGTIGFLPANPKVRTRYPRMKYSEGALALFMQGIPWKEGKQSAVFEPDDKVA